VAGQGTARRGQDRQGEARRKWRGQAWHGTARRGMADNANRSFLVSKVDEVQKNMAGKTGSVTLHFKHGKLLKVEYRIIEPATNELR
jgi:hypothetical protein